MFRIRPFEARTVSWWMASRDVIDFDPPYQRRGHLWSTNDKAFLIDSILNDFDIPKLYLADFSYVDSSLNVSRKQFAVIDGKQRLEAIGDFFDGRLKLKDDFVLAEDPSLEVGGLSYKDLRASYPKLAGKFENYNLSVMSVLTDEEGKINDLFVRLNTNQPLAAPEYRNAMKGVVPPLIRDMAEHPFFREYISFKIRRGQDQQVATKFLLVEFRGDLVDTKRTQLDRLVRDAARAEADTGEIERAANRVKKVLESMTGVFTPRDELLRSQGPLVVYYWLVREVGPAPTLRTFLVEFERQRRINRNLAKTLEPEVRLDPQLLHYDSLNRSINDAGSLKGRFHILIKRFQGQEA